MIGVYLFLATRTARNLVTHRLKRLRQPRYLVATVLGALYFYWSIFARRGFSGGGGTGDPWRVAAGLAMLPHGLLELAGTAALFIVLALAWVVPQSGAALRFSEAEVQFLFTAPLSRRSLIHYKLVRSQAMLILGALVASIVLNGRFWRPGSAPMLLGIWILLATLNLHFLALGLTRTSLIEHGVSAARRRLIVLGVLVALVAAAAWGVRAAFPALRTAAVQGARAALEETVRVGHAGILGVLLFPLRVMVRPALAPDLRAFAIVVPGALALLGLNYAWAVTSQAAFEEASAEASARRARRMERRRAGHGRTVLRAGTSRRAPFALRPAGRPEVAVVWKNLIAAGRVWNVRALVLVGVLLVMSIGLAGGLAHGSGTVFTVAAASLAGVAVLLMLLGATMMRNDLRQDLLALDALKCYPLSGTSMVLAEVLSPVVMLTAAQWLLLAIAALLSPLGGFRQLGLATRLCIILSAMVLAPSLNFVTVTVQNAAVLIFPAWVSLGQSRAQGLEATGQRMINFVGTLLVLLFACVPAALTAGLTLLITWSFMGTWSIPIVALVASLTLAAEGAVALVGLGKLFEKLDPSTAGIT